METTYREKFAGLGPEEGTKYWDVLIDVIAQPYDESAAMKLSADVLPQGRYVERAAPKKRKPRGVKVVEPMGGTSESESVYTRPNGQEYHARLVGRAWRRCGSPQGTRSHAKAFSEGTGSPMFSLLVRCARMRKDRAGGSRVR
jgi:hypothetical protein